MTAEYHLSIRIYYPCKCKFTKGRGLLWRHCPIASVCEYSKASVILRHFTQLGKVPMLDVTMVWIQGRLCNERSRRDRVRREVGRGFRIEGTHAYPWLIHVDVWQKPSQCRKNYFSIKQMKKQMPTNQHMPKKRRGYVDSTLGVTFSHRVSAQWDSLHTEWTVLLPGSCITTFYATTSVNEDPASRKHSTPPIM